mgnify:CR=1 FL=1
MKSLKTLLILGPGPSSSHTIGPYRIASSFLDELQDKGNVSRIEVTLFGSLALTGKGHGTDTIIKKTLQGFKTTVFFNHSFEGLSHPNTMECKAFYTNGSLFERRYESIGGGSFVIEGEKRKDEEVYPFKTFEGLKKYVQEEKIEDLFEVIRRNDASDIYQYGSKMLRSSFGTIERSLKEKGTLPGPLKLNRVAGDIYKKSLSLKDVSEKRTMLLSSYAYATSEANANNELIVTAPTCGAAGVVPACLYYEWKNHHQNLKNLAKAYLVGALTCSFIKENAGVAGALLGCQSEIGSAASFAAASLSYLHGLSLYQIEYAAEVAMEHFLGLTCDPVDGYVQIPCIERNAIAAVHAYASFLYAKNIAPSRKNRVSFDNVIEAMKETGTELPYEFKETSLGGLAKVICS